MAGGGKTARNMQNAARNFHADEAFLDQLGIDVSRIHAKILTTCTTNSCQDIPKTLDEVVRCLSSSKIVFTGGKEVADLIEKNGFEGFQDDA